MQIKIKENCGKQTFDLEATEHELLSLTSDEGKPASSEAEKWSALNTCLSSSSFFRSFCLLLLWASDLKWRTGVSVLFIAKHLHSSSSPHSYSPSGCEFDIKIYKWLGRGIHIMAHNNIVQNVTNKSWDSEVWSCVDSVLHPSYSNRKKEKFHNWSFYCKNMTFIKDWCLCTVVLVIMLVSCENIKL